MYKTILIPLDQSKRAEMILPQVEELAHIGGAKIVLIHVVEPGIMAYTYYGGDTEVDLVLMDQLSRTAAIYLESVRARLQAKGLEASTRVVDGPTVDAILRTAAEEHADLIAMASHGRSGLAHVFHGSVTTGVLRHSNIPLLIIRSLETKPKPDHSTHQPIEKEVAHADRHT